MYCRACGNKITNNTLSCNKCGTKKGEGAKFCQMCGFHTTLKTEFCANCGAKQRTIISQQMKKEKIAQLQRQAKSSKKHMKIEKIFAVVGFALAVILFIIMIARPQPEMTGYVAQPWLSNKVVYGYEVNSYWKQSQEILMYAGMSLLMSIGSLIAYFVEKSNYKKIIKAIKEHSC